MTEVDRESWPKAIERLDAIAEELVINFADSEEADFWMAVIDVDRQMEPQVAAYGQVGKIMRTRVITTAAELRKQLELGVAQVQKTGERTTVTKHDDKGRIVEFEKRDVFGITS